jgi:hypothetical protein
MKLKQLLEQLNQLAKERPEALEMEVYCYDKDYHEEFNIIFADITDVIDGNGSVLIAFTN